MAKKKITVVLKLEKNPANNEHNQSDITKNID